MPLLVKGEVKGIVKVCVLDPESTVIPLEDQVALVAGRFSVADDVT